MTHLQQWYENEANVARLSELLTDPVLERAITVIEKSNHPVFSAGASPTDLAQVHAFQAGIHHVRTALNRLAKPGVEAQEQPPEWEGEHILPPKHTTE